MSLRAFSVSAANLSSIKREEVLSSTDSKWFGSYVQAVVQSGDASGAHSDNINEYFRKNFRKMSAPQALDVINSLVEIGQKPSECLDEKFWVWESLEEALRPEINTLTAEEFHNVMLIFSVNYKGSQEMKDMIEFRIYRDGPDLSSVIQGQGYGIEK